MSTFSRVKLGVLAAVSLMGCGGSTSQGETVGEVSSALTTTATTSLVITDVSVTRDATRTKDPCSTVPGDEDKVWTMGHLLKREAQKYSLSSSTYVANWMNAWTGTVTINGQTVPPLLGPSTRTTWNDFAGGSTSLPLHKAPFWLLAIASRLDLRRHRPLGEPLGGEVRFIFGFLGANGVNPACPTSSWDPTSTVIFEYSPAKADENAVRDWGRRWLALSTLSGSAYRSALQTLTEEVVNTGKLMHIRTNEGPAQKVGGTSSGWDMGEFEPDPTTHYMKRSTLKQSPTMALADGTSQLMSSWIWANRDALFANAFDYEVGRAPPRTVTDAPIASYSVPDKFPGTSTWFRGSLNSLVGSGFDFWSGPVPAGVSADAFDDARFRFSIGTCRGCHGAETNTSFLHIGPGGGPGTEATRSPFLSGYIEGAGGRGLDEMTRRERDLRNLVNGAPVMDPVLGNNYTVVFQNSGKCMDSESNTTTDGALSKLYGCHGNANQRLSFVSVGAGVYNLKYKHSGKCIDVENGSTANGARVVQLTCSGARTSQKLTLDTLAAPIGTPGPRVLRFQHSNLCLLVQNQGTADGTQIIQASCPSVTDFAKGFNLVE